MSYNTFELMPYDKFFGKIYKSFQNEGKELTSEMQNTVEIYDQNYAAADEQQERFAPAPARLAEAVDERVELAPLAPVVPLASLAAKGQVKLQCHETLAASAAITTAKSAVANPIQQDEINALLGNSPRARGSSPPNSPMSSSGLRQRRRASQGGKRKTKFKKNIKVYNKTSKKYKNKNTSRY